MLRGINCTERGCKNAQIGRLHGEIGSFSFGKVRNPKFLKAFKVLFLKIFKGHANSLNSVDLKCSVEKLNFDYFCEAFTQGVLLSVLHGKQVNPVRFQQMYLCKVFVSLLNSTFLKRYIFLLIIMLSQCIPMYTWEFAKKN